MVNRSLYRFAIVIVTTEIANNVNDFDSRFAGPFWRFGPLRGDSVARFRSL